MVTLPRDGSEHWLKGLCDVFSLPNRQQLQINIAATAEMIAMATTSLFSPLPSLNGQDPLAAVWVG